MPADAVNTTSSPARTAVVTITSGRDEHLHRLRLGLVADPPQLHVIVGMGGTPHLRHVAGAPGVSMVQVPLRHGALPLAASRNAGAKVALDAGADVVVFLDVDCIPGPSMLSHYARAARRVPSPSLLCGPVRYLPPPPPEGYPTVGLDRLAAPHPARPAPPDGQLVAATRFELFWSLSFATSATSWRHLGGFHEGYVGYGAEDTDFARSAASAGATMWWVGGADASHQHHPPSRADPARITEMVRNARLFYSRHGSWPMRAWLEELAAGGHVDFDPDSATLRVARPLGSCREEGPT